MMGKTVSIEEYLETDQATAAEKKQIRKFLRELDELDVKKEEKDDTEVRCV